MDPVAATNSASQEETKSTNPQLKYEWTAPLRPYTKRSPEVLRFYIAVALLVSAIILFTGDRILIVPVWAMLFIFYILTVTPPEDITHRITQFGIETAGGTYRWSTLSHFYYTQRFGYIVLVVVGNAPQHHHLLMVVPNEEVKKKVTTLLSEHIVYQEHPTHTVTDKMIDWFSQLVPQEEFTPNQSASQTQTQASL